MEEKLKKSKKNKKIFIGVLIAIVILIISVTISVIILSPKDEVEEKKEENVFFDYSDSEVDMNNTTNAEIKDGLKIATSEKIKEEKIYNDMKVLNAEITATKNRSHFSAMVKNDFDKQIEGEVIDVIFLNQDGSEIARIETFFPDLEPNGEGQITLSSEKDIANAYDFRIVTQKQQNY